MSEKIEFDRVCDFFKSDNIESVAYSSDSRVLLVHFKNQTSYRYYDVPFDVWASVVVAQSVGSAFNKFVIRNDFRYEKVSYQNAV